MFAASAFALAAVASCGGSPNTTLVLRDADDLQVMTPEEVALMRAEATVAPSTPVDPTGTDTDPESTDTIPLNQDDRPAELKLFDAYAQFRGCIEDSGETIRGNLQDPNNPAYVARDDFALELRTAGRGGPQGLQVATEQVAIVGGVRHGQSSGNGGYESSSSPTSRTARARTSARRPMDSSVSLTLGRSGST